MRHFNGIELRVAPLTCVVHHRHVLCTMVHKGDLNLFLVEVDMRWKTISCIMMKCVLAIPVWVH